jgi:hypothetical protein
MKASANISPKVWSVRGPIEISGIIGSDFTRAAKPAVAARAAGK